MAPLPDAREGWLEVEVGGWGGGRGACLRYSLSSLRMPRPQGWQSMTPRDSQWQTPRLMGSDATERSGEMGGLRRDPRGARTQALHRRRCRSR